jgi:hypothetical protein
MRRFSFSECIVLAVVFATLSGAETAKAGLKYSQPGVWIDARPEPKTIFAGMGLAHSAVGSASVDIECMLPIDYSIVSRDILVDNCLDRPIGTGKNRWIPVMRRDGCTYVYDGLVGARSATGIFARFDESARSSSSWRWTEWAGPLLLCRNLGGHRNSEAFSGGVEDAEGRSPSRVFKNDEDFYRLIFLERAIQFRRDWSQPRPVAYLQGGVSNVSGSLRFAESLINEVQSEYSSDDAQSRYYIKPTGYFELAPPKVGLVGAMFFFGGAWLTSWGFRRNVLGPAHIAGWLAMVFGGVILLRCAFPLIAEMVPTP